MFYRYTVPMDGVKAGTKVQSETGAEVIVVKPPSGPGLAFRPGGDVLLGKRYACETCGAEVLVTKGGNAAVVCHDAPMALAQPKTLPSSD